MIRHSIICLLFFFGFLGVVNGQVPDTLADSVECIEVLADTQENIIPAIANEEHINIIPRVSGEVPSWLFAIFFAQLVIIAYLRKVFTKDFEDLMSGLFNINIAHQLFREQELSMPFSAILYNLNSVLSGSLFVFIINHHFGFVRYWHDLDLFLIITWIVIMLYAAKYIVMKLAAIVFPFKEELDSYNFNFYLIQKITGLVLFPLNLLLAYSPESLQPLFIVVAVSVLIILFLLTSYKGVVIGKNYLRNEKFHFILYICTLELAPLLILSKIIMGWIN